MFSDMCFLIRWLYGFCSLLLGVLWGLTSRVLIDRLSPFCQCRAWTHWPKNTIRLWSNSRSLQPQGTAWLPKAHSDVPTTAPAPGQGWTQGITDFLCDFRFRHEPTLCLVQQEPPEKPDVSCASRRHRQSHSTQLEAIWGDARVKQCVQGSAMLVLESVAKVIRDRQSSDECAAQAKDSQLGSPAWERSSLKSSGEWTLGAGGVGNWGPFAYKYPHTILVDFLLGHALLLESKFQTPLLIVEKGLPPQLDCVSQGPAHDLCLT